MNEVDLRYTASCYQMSNQYTVSVYDTRVLSLNTEIYNFSHCISSSNCVLPCLFTAHLLTVSFQSAARLHSNAAINLCPQQTNSTTSKFLHECSSSSHNTRTLQNQHTSRSLTTHETNSLVSDHINNAPLHRYHAPLRFIPLPTTQQHILLLHATPSRRVRAQPHTRQSPGCSINKHHCAPRCAEAACA
jgi:hypothetical protein